MATGNSSLRHLAMPLQPLDTNNGAGMLSSQHFHPLHPLPMRDETAEEEREIVLSPVVATEAYRQIVARAMGGVL